MPVTHWYSCPNDFKMNSHKSANFRLQYAASSHPDEFPQFMDVANFISQQQSFDHINFSRKLKHQNETKKLDY